MNWYRWKLGLLAWSLNGDSRVECGGWVWRRVVGNLMFRCERSKQ